MVRRTLLAVVSCVPLTALGISLAAADKPAAPNTLTDAEQKAGWKLLFDGKSADAWRAYRGKGLPPEWKVAGGELQLHDKGGKLAPGIVTREEFADFELALEWRISQGGNSGVLYRV